jgi:hypothetical protein
MENILSGSTYDQHDTLRAARDVYFRRFGFDNGGYDDKWVRLQVGPIPFFFPNLPARVIAVKYHDLHHVLADYPANWVGESEIGAWEVASGCGRHWPAWILNLDALAIGLAIAPRKTYRAFVRGRHTDNLYRRRFDDRLLARTVSDVRRQLKLDRPTPRASAATVASFVGWSAIAVATLTIPPLAIATAAFVLGRRLFGS